MFGADSPPALPERVFVVYAHANDSGPDLSSDLDDFNPPFFPSDKVDSFSHEEFATMAKVFRRADDAVNHLYRCSQSDMITCTVYRLEEQTWVPDEQATDYFLTSHINY